MNKFLQNHLKWLIPLIVAIELFALFVAIQPVGSGAGPRFGALPTPYQSIGTTAALTSGQLLVASGNYLGTNYSGLSWTSGTNTLNATNFSGNGSGISGVAGTISGLTTGKIPVAASATSLGDGPVWTSGTSTLTGNISGNAGGNAATATTATTATNVSGGGTVLASVYPTTPVATVSTVGAATLSAANLKSGIIVRSGTQTAAWTDTTDTAANIIAGVSGAVTNTAFKFTILNTTTYLETIAAGSSVTLTPSTIMVAPSSALNCIAIMTNVSTPAVTIYALDNCLFGTAAPSANANATGVLNIPFTVNMINLPTSDPHVAGEVWVDTNGKLTVSSG
jgi:hypothetical protein